MAVPFLPINTPINAGGVTDQTWKAYFLDTTGAITSLTTIVNAVPGVNVFTVATQPSLGAGDAGYLGWLSDYNHFVRWTGAAWQFFGGDQAGSFQYFAVAPQGVGWQLCDGTSTKYLTMGVTLTETAFTTPNIAGSPSYLKAGAAYTGTLNAVSGVTGTGTTGTDVTGTGTTGTPTVGVAIGHTTTPIIVEGNAVTLPVTVSGHVSGNVIDDGVQTHSVPALTVPGLSIPALGVGSIDMANLGVPLYFRR